MCVRVRAGLAWLHAEVPRVSGAWQRGTSGEAGKPLLRGSQPYGPSGLWVQGPRTGVSPKAR